MHIFLKSDFPFFASSQSVRLHTITLRYKLASLTNIVQHNTTMKYTFWEKNRISYENERRYNNICYTAKKGMFGKKKWLVAKLSKRTLTVIFGIRFIVQFASSRLFCIWRLSYTISFNHSLSLNSVRTYLLQYPDARTAMKR